MPLRHHKQLGFGLVQSLILFGVVATMAYVAQSRLSAGRKQLQGLVVTDSLEKILNETALALRDYNYCPQFLVPAGGINATANPPQGSNEVTVKYPGANGTVIAQKDVNIPPYLKITSAQLKLVRPVGDVSQNTYLLELGLTAAPLGESFGGLKRRGLPLYVQLSGGTIQKCFSTSYMPPPVGTTLTDYTFEDTVCNIDPAPTPTPSVLPSPAPSPSPVPPRRFSPWPAPPPTGGGYCQ